MHPGDRLGPIPDGVTCTACGADVPAAWIRILAHREDLAFVELSCARCGSAALGLLLASDEPGEPPFLDVAVDRSPVPVMDGPVAVDPAPAPMPITQADVLAMHDFLSDWQGDLRGLLAGGL